MKLHFETLYPNAKGYEFFQYNSSKPGKVCNFATSANIQIKEKQMGREVEMTTKIKQYADQINGIKEKL